MTATAARCGWVPSRRQRPSRANSAQEQIGHFVLRGHVAGERPGGGPDIRDLYPFICYVPDARQQHRLHYYDSIYRYQETRKDVRVLEYDEGFKQVTPEPVAGLEARFTRELLARAFGAAPEPDGGDRRTCGQLWGTAGRARRHRWPEVRHRACEAVH